MGVDSSSPRSAPDEQVIHTALSSLFLAHMGWALVENPEFRVSVYSTLCKGFVRDPFYMMVERNYAGCSRLLGHFFLGRLHCRAVSGRYNCAAVQFGFSLLLWGAIVRTSWSGNIPVGQFGGAPVGVSQLCHG